MNQQLHDAEAIMTEHDTVGATLRAARKARGMSLQELAAQSGVSVGMISQVERGRANPSMRLLTALRRALNISLQELFGESGGAPSCTAGDPDFVRRAVDRPVIDLGHLQKELLTSGGRHNLQVMLLKIEPGGDSGGSALSYPAEKGGLVLSGEIALSVNGQQAVLRAGDSFAFDSAHPHSIRNNGAAKAEVIWIIGAVRFDRHL
ncbi:helix-turn-helix domain-containing protein [Paracoccus sp. Z118]|uniref:helix-turn-helix domain-containing protein n=1 Tax=Paracoccus sp. Z118 TaxID=2851017 RepID=UPI0020B7B063|nr:helix-turn-helix domain-containing protein [Paracoccus sp. Z118]